MLDVLRRRLDAWPLILGSGAVYALSQWWIGRIVHPLGADMLRVQTVLSADGVREIFASWEARGLLETYAAHYAYDRVHPLWYAVFLASAMARALNASRAPSSRSVLLLLPIIAGGCDVLENSVHLTFLADRANITQAAVLLGNGAAWVKWTLVLVSMVLIARGAWRSRARTHGDAPS